MILGAITKVTFFPTPPLNVPYPLLKTVGIVLIFFLPVVIITTMNGKQVIKQLETQGWYLARVKGSHHQFKHPSRPGLVTVKHPDSDIPAGTLNSIKKQAGWK